MVKVRSKPSPVTRSPAKLITDKRVRERKRVARIRPEDEERDPFAMLVHSRVYGRLTPLDVLLRDMWNKYKAGDLNAAANRAVDAAPYCHPKFSAISVMDQQKRALDELSEDELLAIALGGGNETLAAIRRSGAIAEKESQIRTIDMRADNSAEDGLGARASSRPAAKRPRKTRPADG